MTDEVFEHPSSSHVQRAAEIQILQLLSGQLGFGELSKPGSTEVRGAKIQLDGASLDGSVVIEVYAHQGPLKGSQFHKVARDILKLATLKQDPKRATNRAIVAFANREARDSVRGWLREAAETFGVELAVVEIPDRLRDEISSAQSLQEMVNPPDTRSSAGSGPGGL